MCILCFSFHIVCVTIANMFNHCLWQPVWLHLFHCETLKTSDSLACTCVYSARRPRQVFDNQLHVVRSGYILQWVYSRSRRIRAVKIYMAARACLLVYIGALLRWTHLRNCRVYTTLENTQAHGGSHAKPAEKAE